MYRRLMGSLMLAGALFNAAAQDNAAVRNNQKVPPEESTLAELAADADLIAVVRVRDAQYERIRDFPSAGYAYLEVLIAYKGTQKGSVIEVQEKGLGEDKCYYPELGTWQFEGDRFLVFLKRGKGKAVYRGRAPGCRLPVLVTADNRYALRYPVRGLRIDSPDAVQPIDYLDPAAYVDAADFTSAGIQELESYYQARRVVPDDPLAPPSLKYVYTLGVPISRLRELLASP